MDDGKKPSALWPAVERAAELALKIATTIIQLIDAVHGGR